MMLHKLEGEEAVEIFDLVVKNKMLPAKLDDLVPLSFIGQAAVSFYRAKVRAMTELGMTEEQRKITLRDGQDAGELLLQVEARIGELLPEDSRHVPYGERDEKNRALPKGIERKRAHAARAIARYPEIVEEVKKQARENEDIPTKTAVINRINYEKEKKRREAAEGKRKGIKAIISADQLSYILALDKCINILPQRPPKTWNETAFAEAKAKAQIIRKRLEVFTE